jgi:hypothetical protein
MIICRIFRAYLKDHVEHYFNILSQISLTSACNAFIIGRLERFTKDDGVTAWRMEKIPIPSIKSRSIDSEPDFQVVQNAMQTYSYVIKSCWNFKLEIVKGSKLAPKDFVSKSSDPVC